MDKLALNLFLLTVNLSQIKDREILISIYESAVNNLLNSFKIHFITLAENESFKDNENTLDVTTSSKSYGKIKYQILHADSSAEFELFQNSVSMLAIFLEKIETDELLNNEKDLLVNLVEERTKTLNTTEEMFKQLADNIDEIFWLRTKEKVIYISPAFENIFGISSSDIYENPKILLEYLHPDDKSKVLSDVIAYEFTSKEVFNVEFRIVKPDSSIRWILSKSFPIIENDEVVRRAGIAVDFTEKIQKEKELKQAKNKAEDASKIKSEFLANVSHELRTPLNGILGFTDLLLQDSTLDFEHKEFLNIIYSSSLKLKDIIESILQFSNFESNSLKISKQEFDFKKLCYTILRRFKEEAELKQLDLNISYNAFNTMIFSDMDAFAQILINLLGNALKFTMTGGIQLIIDNGSDFEIRVIDTGIGIAQEKLDTVFEPFQQLEAPYTKTHNGIGLGLTIVRTLTESLGGYVTIKSLMGVGTEVIVKFPNSILAIPETIKGSSKNPKKVLIVEDDNMNLLYLKKIMKRNSIDFDIALNGMQALDKYLTYSYHCILMDISLPVMNGIEATLKIREYERITGSYTPIVAITASAYEYDKEKSLEAGMDDFLTKPVSEEEIMRVILRFQPQQK